MRQFMMITAAIAALFMAIPVATAIAEPAAVAETKVDEAKEATPEAKEATKAEAKEAEGFTAEEEEEAPSVEELVKTGEGVVQAARSQEWALMVAGAIMLLVGIARRFALIAKLPNRLIPWASMVIGVLAVLADDLSAGGAITITRVVQGMLAGMAASGAWGMIGRHLPMVGKAAKPTST